MLELTGNIWRFYNDGAWICITTNCGWKKNGENVMGRGVAKQAAERFKDIPFVYGSICQSYFESYPDQTLMPCVTLDRFRMVMFPTKKVDPRTPWLSWQSDSSLEQIRESVRTLWEILDRIPGKLYLPRPGCGNGGLDWADVKPIVQQLPNRVVVITNQS